MSNPQALTADAQSRQRWSDDRGKCAPAYFRICAAEQLLSRAVADRAAQSNQRQGARIMNYHFEPSTEEA